jgi:hypothetical protein
MPTAWATTAAMVAISVVGAVLFRSGCRLRLLSLRRESLPRSLPDLRREELRLRSLDRSRLSRPRSSRPRTLRRSAPRCCAAEMGSVIVCSARTFCSLRRYQRSSSVGATHCVISGCVSLPFQRCYPVAVRRWPRRLLHHKCLHDDC